MGGRVVRPRLQRGLVLNVLHACLIVAVTASTGCRSTPSSVAHDPPAASPVSGEALAFMNDVALGVTRDGPIAWKRYFASGPEFYMASEGRLVFDGGEAARKAIDELTRTVERIELRWGEPIRADALTATRVLISAPYYERIVSRSGTTTDEQGWLTGLAEEGPEGWRFLNLHWSVAPQRKDP